MQRQPKGSICPVTQLVLVLSRNIKRREKVEEGEEDEEKRFNLLQFNDSLTRCSSTLSTLCSVLIRFFFCSSCCFVFPILPHVCQLFDAINARMWSSFDQSIKKSAVIDVANRVISVSTFHSTFPCVAKLLKIMSIGKIDPVASQVSSCYFFTSNRFAERQDDRRDASLNELLYHICIL